MSTVGITSVTTKEKDNENNLLQQCKAAVEELITFNNMNPSGSTNEYVKLTSKLFELRTSLSKVNSAAASATQSMISLHESQSLMACCEHCRAWINRYAKQCPWPDCNHTVQSKKLAPLS